MSIKSFTLLLTVLAGSCCHKNTKEMQGKSNVGSTKKPVKYHHVIPNCTVLSEKLYRKVKNKEVIDKKFVLQYLESIREKYSVKRMREIIKLEKIDDVNSKYLEGRTEIETYLSKDELVTFGDFVKKLEGLCSLREQKYFCIRKALCRFKEGDNYWPWD